MVSDAERKASEAGEADLVQAVLGAATEALPPSPDGSDPLAFARDLIENSGEAVEGLRMVAWATHDAQVRVPARVVGAIRDLTAGTFAGDALPYDVDAQVE